MATIRLTVLERIKLLMILPQQGDLVMLRIIRRLQDALSFSEEEHARLELGFDEKVGRYTWNPKKTFEKPIEFGMKAREMIRGLLRAMNTEKVLPLEMVSLTEKFCPDLAADADEETGDGAAEATEEVNANGALVPSA